MALHAELQASTGKVPPAELPGKHNFRIIKKVADPRIIEERRSGLEAYLKAILSHKDPRWRTSYGFSDFIALASNTGSGSKADPNSTANKLASILPTTTTAEPLLTSASWLSEHSSMTSTLRTIRSSILKRDALAQMGDSSASRSAGVEAKRAIKDAKSRMNVLESALGRIEGLGTGERQRREGMMGTLRDELANLERMAEAGIRVATNTMAMASRSSPNVDRSNTSTPANDANRAALLGSVATRPAAATGRVFGAAAQETTITRPLDDVGLVQLQKTQIDTQDSQLRLLSETLARQRLLGEEIGREIGEQNEMLDGLTTDVDRTAGKLGRAKREMNK